MKIEFLKFPGLLLIILIVESAQSQWYDADIYLDYVEHMVTRVETTTEEKEPYKYENYTKYVVHGMNVRLDCKGIFDENTVLMWYNGSKIIVQGKVFQITDNRIRVSKKDGSLTIDNVDSYDSGCYRCRVFHPSDIFETVIELIVNAPPKMIEIGHNRRNSFVLGKNLIYKAGEKELRFKCNVPIVHPEAKITWIHNENAIQESRDRDIKIIEENILEIRVLHAKHAGEYVCEATNEYGSIKANFSIDVQFPPFFRPHHNFFNADISNDVEIFCTYKASPPATSVKWFKNGNQIHENDKYSIKADERDHHDRTKLLIKDVEQNDLGAYYCEVQNSLGTKKENITLDLVPAPPKFEAFKYINNYLYTDWIVNSYQQVQDMVIMYQNYENGSKDFTKDFMKIISHNILKPGKIKVQGSISFECGNWTFYAQARNNYGWSSDTIDELSNILIDESNIDIDNQSVSPSSSSFFSTSAWRYLGVVFILCNIINKILIET